MTDSMSQAQAGQDEHEINFFCTRRQRVLGKLLL